MATDVWTNKTVTVDHVEAKPFGNGIDVCPVCGKPSTIGKPITNADRIRAMSDEELAEFAAGTGQGCAPGENFVECCFDHQDGPVEADCRKCWLDWLKEEAVSDG